MRLSIFFTVGSMIICDPNMLQTFSFEGPFARGQVAPLIFHDLYSDSSLLKRFISFKSNPTCRFPVYLEIKQK